MSAKVSMERKLTRVMMLRNSQADGHFPGVVEGQEKSVSGSAVPVNPSELKRATARPGEQ